LQLRLFLLMLLFLVLPFTTYAEIIEDLTNDYTITIDLTKNKKKDATSDKKDQTDDEKKGDKDQTDDIKEKKYIFGNKWYSRQNFYIMNSCEMGLSGTKDFISESFLFKYRFRSKNNHAFAIRLFHHGFAPGVFSGNFTYFNFAVMGGFEYLYKIFSATEGFFLWSDLGGTNKGVATGLGIGLGDRNKNGVELYINYMHNLAVISRLDFYFLFADIFVLRGKLGIDLKFTEGMSDIDIFTFLNGLYIGVFVKQIFRIELGGGFTVNQYGYFSGFGGAILIFNIY